MKLRCLNINCNYNKDNECQRVYMYVNCFKLDEQKSDKFIFNYLNNNDKTK